MHVKNTLLFKYSRDLYSSSRKWFRKKIFQISRFVATIHHSSSIESSILLLILVSRGTSSAQTGLKLSVKFWIILFKTLFKLSQAFWNVKYNIFYFNLFPCLFIFRRIEIIKFSTLLSIITRFKFASNKYLFFEIHVINKYKRNL